MKKLVYLFIAGTFVLSSCSKEETPAPAKPAANPQVAVEKKNTALIQGVFSTKNKECGEWGWGMKEELIAYDATNSLFMGIHPTGPNSGNFAIDLGATMEQVWQITEYPVFVANGVPKVLRSAGTVNVDGEKTLCKIAIDNHKGDPIVANTGMEMSIADGKIKIKASSKFFVNAVGNYNVAFYVVENGAMSPQNGKSTTDIAHQYVMRGSANGAWGAAAFSNPSADSFKDINAEIAIDSEWNQANLNVYAVIWEVRGNDYLFVNASKAK